MAHVVIRGTLPTHPHHQKEKKKNTRQVRLTIVRAARKNLLIIDNIS